MRIEEEALLPPPFPLSLPCARVEFGERSAPSLLSLQGGWEPRDEFGKEKRA